MPTQTLRAHRTQAKRPRASVLSLSTEHADPLHLQLREQLRSKIDSEYSDGEYFFTEQELIRQLSVSRVTVRRALDDLRREGLLKRQAGKGTIVVKPSVAEKAEGQNSPIASANMFANLECRVHTIGIIVSGFASEYGSALMDSVSENCDRRELHHQVYSTNLGARTDSALARITLPPEEVAFICFLAPYQTLDVTTRLTLRGYRSIAVDGIPSGYTGPSVTTDSRAAIRIGLDNLWSLGHKSITLLVNEPIRDETVTDKIEEFALAMREHGLIQRAKVVLCGTQHGSSSYEAAYKHMNEVWPSESSQRPTAIFTVSDPGAWAVLKWLDEQGVRVPHDVSVMGFEDARPSAHVTPPLTTIAHPLEAIVERAVAVLASGQDLSSIKEQIAPSLIKRKSVGPARGN